MKKTLIAMSAFLAIVAMGSHVARADEMGTTTDPSLTEVRPVDASPLHLTPMILGQVASTTEHSVTLNTARGESMTFEIDSRTVMPVNLANDSRVKVEFHLMDNGMHHAGRITTIQPGSREWTRLEEQLSYLRQDDSEPMAVNSEATPVTTTDNTGMNNGNNALISSSEPATDVNASEANTNEATADRTDVIDSNANANADNTSGELPRTASNRTWMLVLGLGVFAAAFGQRMMRKNSLI